LLKKTIFTVLKHHHNKKAKLKDISLLGYAENRVIHKINFTIEKSAEYCSDCSEQLRKKYAFKINLRLV
jgi:hypothetical protein